MKTFRILTICALASALLIYSCKKDQSGADPRYPVLPDETYKYDNVQPNANGFNPTGAAEINNDKATLGRVLFYENQLSINNRVSCGSCHNQLKGFADNKSFSDGFENKKTLRNTPSIVNPGVQSFYFWDMRESSLSAMVTQPIANHIEMGLEQPEYMIAKLKKLSYYEPLFTNAFGDAEVTSERIGIALSNFVASMVSVDSKYDQAIANNFANFTSDELRGKKLFMEDLPCAGCHGGENFSGWSTFTQNIGLELDYADDGQPGVDWMTGHEQDGWFKIPSLRNVELTPPYMHDGRFNTLEEVVEFYNSGIQAHDQLSFNLREGWNGVFDSQGIPFSDGEVRPLRLNLSNSDKQALVAFLKTLTDSKSMNDVKFSDPFQHP
jgi:cytochrome c peroxidase